MQGKSSADHNVLAEVYREEASSLDAAADKATDPVLSAALRAYSADDRDRANGEAARAQAQSDEDTATAVGNPPAALAASERVLEAQNEVDAAGVKATDDWSIVSKACGWS